MHFAAQKLTNDDVSKAVMLMRPNVDSVRDVTRLLLEQTDSASPDAFTEQSTHYLVTLNEMVLNWMAEGRHDELRLLASVFRDGIASSAQQPRLLSNMSQHDHLTIRIEVIIRQIAQLLRGDSLAKHMGFLSGKRRESYRRLLVGLYFHLKNGGMPVIRREAYKFVPQGMKRETGEAAVDKLTKAGLLSKQKLDAKKVQVEVTWAGRRAAQALVDGGLQNPIPLDGEPLQYVGEKMSLEEDLEKVGLDAFILADKQAIDGTEGVDYELT